jgi:hypothetical protein
MKPEELLFEGYEEEAGIDTRRYHMTDLQYMCDGGKSARDSGGSDGPICGLDEKVELDGVGGAIVLVSAALHREGLYFPPFACGMGLEHQGPPASRGSRAPLLQTQPALCSPFLEPAAAVELRTTIQLYQLNAALGRRFNHSIETEGLAKVAKEMGHQPYGFPSVRVWHK